MALDAGLIEQLRDLQAELKRAMFPDISVIDNAIAELTHLAAQRKCDVSELEELRPSLAAAREQARAALRKSDELKLENETLRDQLHHMTIENARMQGYQARVQEFDPVPERIVYADDTRPLRRREEMHGDGAGIAAMMAPREMPRASWYQRRRD